MKTAKDYDKKVWETLGTIAKGKEIHIKWETIAEAKLHRAKIVQVQKELRLIKKDVGITKKSINSYYVSEKAKVGKGIGAGITSGIFGKKSSGKMNVITRNRLRNSQLNQVAPYDQVSREIDSIIMQLDQLKMKIDTWLVENSKSNP